MGTWNSVGRAGMDYNGVIVLSCGTYLFNMVWFQKDGDLWPCMGIA